MLCGAPVLQSIESILKISMQIAKPEIRIIIPQLFQPLLLWQKDFRFTPVAANLSRLLQNFELVSSHGKTGIYASLFACAAYAERQELAIAYYRFLANTKYIKKGGDGYLDKTHQESLQKTAQKLKQKHILCADPVHLEVGLNDMTLTRQIDDLQADEVNECIDALNRHFQQDGLEFLPASRCQWYLLSDTELVSQSTPLTEVLNKNIAHFLPASNHANWKMIQNEVQMILHALPLNQKREMAGLPTLNSLWFYGGGQPQENTRKIDRVYADSRGFENRGELFSEIASCDYYPLPENSLGILDGEASRQLIILDQLEAPALCDNLEEYQRQLGILDDYLEALMQHWRNGKIELEIDACNGKLLKPLKPSSWQFWKRKATSLTEIAREIAS